MRKKDRMEKEKAVQEIEDAIKKCEDGSYNLPLVFRAFLIGLLYLVEHHPLG